MGMLETSHKWALNSTVAPKAVNLRGYAMSITAGFETSSGCTATVSLMHRMGSSAGPYSALSSQSLSTGAFQTQQFLGPLEWVKPRVSDITAGSTNSVTVYLYGN